MRKEDTLIQISLRTVLTPDQEAMIKEFLTSSLDWDYIMEASQREGVSCLIYNNIKKYGIHQIAGVRAYETLRKIYYTNSLRNIEIFQKTVEILKALESIGVQAIILKGVFLSEKVYGNIALRPMGDIDMLIKRTCLAKTNEVLSSLGYIPQRCYMDFLKNEGASSINSLMYKKKSPPVSYVHLHWHLVNSSWPLDSLVRKIDMQRIWSHAQSVQIDGISTLTLAPEHLLIYLCLHAFCHNFDKLILLSDINMVLARYKDVIDWEFFCKEAERFGLSHIVNKALKRNSRGSYILSYTGFLFLQEGLSRKVRFIIKTIIPPRLILAQNLNMAVSEIGSINYFRRITGRILNFS